MDQKKIGGLRISRLSPSAIQVFEQCLLKYWFQYHTKEKGIGDSQPLRFGRVVHKALENMNKRLLQGEKLTPELCEQYAEEFVQLAAQSYIADPALIEEGKQFMRERIHRHNPQYKIVGIEYHLKSFNVTTDKGVPLNGVIDLVMEMDPSSAIVLDYKTSRKAKTVVEAKTDIQLSLYDLAISKLNPQYQKIWLALEYLRSEVVLSDRSLEERRDFEQWINALWEALGDMSEKDVEPSLNEYCPWCDFRHKCHSYRNVLSGHTEVTPIIALADPKEFTQEWKKVKSLEKIAKNRLEELKGWANNQVLMEGITQFSDDSTIVSWSQSAQTYYDLNSLIPSIPPQDLPRLVSIKKDVLKRYLNTERPDLKPAVEAASRVSSGAPRLTTKGK